MKQLRKLINNLPSLATALVFAVAVWLFAVTQADPTAVRNYPRPIEVDVIGLDPNLMITNDVVQQVSLAIRAPSTILNQLEGDINLIDVTLDLSGLEAGSHTITPQVNLGLSPAEVVRMTPSSVSVELDAIVTQTFAIELNIIGSPTIGFELEDPQLDQEEAFVSGPRHLVERVDMVIVEINILDTIENIQQLVEVQAVDIEGVQVEGVTISPSSVQVNIPVTQRGGFRTVVVKIVTTGQIAPGYRLTNIFSVPPTVTLFSSDLDLIETFPGVVETTPINLNNASEDLEIRVALNLPQGVNVVGSQNVTVQVGIEPIQSSLSFTNVPVVFEGLAEGLEVEFSPDLIGVFLSGPLNILDQLRLEDLIVLIDLTNRGPGTYQLTPEVIIEFEELTVDAILPNTIEVIITEQ